MITNGQQLNEAAKAVLKGLGFVPDNKFPQSRKHLMLPKTNITAFVCFFPCNIGLRIKKGDKQIYFSNNNVNAAEITATIEKEK